MKVEHLLLGLLVTLVLMASVVMVSAEESGIDSVILTTDANYPDTMVASVAADMAGIPLLLTEKSRLPDDVKSEIESLNVSTVYLIGGPEAISEDVENGLTSAYTVVRIWGMTRYGTSADVAEYFWGSSEKAMLVWDHMGAPENGNYELLAEAKDLAIQEDIPVLLINRDGIPSDVVEALVNLSVKSVVLVGNLGSDAKTALVQLGISVSDEIKGADENQTRVILRERIRNKIMLNKERPLVVVAVGSWNDTIGAPYRPNGTSRHISSEGQIGDLISEIQQNNYSRIMIVGKPELARVVYDRLTAAGINATLVSGRNIQVAIQVMKNELARIRVRKNGIKARLEAMHRRQITAFLNNTEALIDRAENFLNKAGISEELKNRVMNELTAMKNRITSQVNAGNYTQAWRLYKNMESRVLKLVWQYRNRLVSEYGNIVARENNIEKNLERLQQLKNIRNRIASGGQGR